MAEPRQPPVPPGGRLWLTALIAVVMLVGAGMTVKETACAWSRCEAPGVQLEWGPAGVSSRSR